MLNVESLQNGVVIDHITAGRGMEVYRLLQLQDHPQTVALLQGVHSAKYGRKDLIKLECGELPPRLEILGYLDKRITIIEIQNGAVVRKYHPVPPQRLVNVVRCKNPRCITGIEADCEPVFRLSPSGKYRCLYCDAELPLGRTETEGSEHHV